MTPERKTRRKAKDFLKSGELELFVAKPGNSSRTGMTGALWSFRSRHESQESVKAE
jgi:hypothetical protein